MKKKLQGKIIHSVIYTELGRFIANFANNLYITYFAKLLSLG